MREKLLGHIKDLVEYPDEVKVVETRVPGKAAFEIACRKSDYGFVIGKQGSHLQALRTIIGAMGAREGISVYIGTADDREPITDWLKRGPVKRGRD